MKPSLLKSPGVPKAPVETLIVRFVPVGLVVRSSRNELPNSAQGPFRFGAGDWGISSSAGAARLTSAFDVLIIPLVNSVRPLMPTRY